MTRVQTILAILASLGMFATLLSGCAAKGHGVSADSVVLLEPGMSRATVKQVMKQEDQHEITAEVDGAYIVITTHAVNPWLPVAYVYRDDTLEKIVDPPRGQWAAGSYKGVESRTMSPVVSEQRLQAILDASPLSDQVIADRIAERQRARQRAAEHSETAPGLRFATLISAPLLPIAMARDAKRNSDHEELARKQDPWRITPGMTQAEVATVLGEPDYRREQDGEVVFVYGTYIVGKSTTYPRPSPVAVHFKDDRAVRIFSHGSFDPGLLEPAS